MAAMPLEAGERPAACPLVLSGVSSACGARLWAVPPAQPYLFAQKEQSAIS